MAPNMAPSPRMTRPEQLVLLVVVILATVGLYYWTPEPLHYFSGLVMGLMVAGIAKRVERP